MIWICINSNFSTPLLTAACWSRYRLDTSTPMAHWQPPSAHCDSIR